MSDNPNDGNNPRIGSGLLFWLIGFVVVYFGLQVEPFIPKWYAMGISLTLVALSFFGPALKQVAWFPQILAGAVMAVAIV